MIKMIFIGSVVVVSIKKADDCEEFPYSHIFTALSHWLSSGFTVFSWM